MLLTYFTFDFFQSMYKQFHWLLPEPVDSDGLFTYKQQDNEKRQLSFTLQNYVSMK